MDAIVTSIEKFFPYDIVIQDRMVTVDLLKYTDSLSMFGRKLAILGRSKNDAPFDPSKLFLSKLIFLCFNLILSFLFLVFVY